ncbi:MAG: radical SAM protein [Candidatus Omnitrophica bacterium]|nr:radical SAM protein [Candidatus Omnitrophota bacterium]
MDAFFRDFLFWISRLLAYPFSKPQVLQLSVTYRCNLNCKMCSIAHHLDKEEELSTEQIFHVIDEAKRYGIKEILLTGGEPFLREDIYRILKYIGDNQMFSIVTTNGTGINRETVNKVANSGINHFHFSLDGLSDMNDYFRGEGVFEKVLDAITLLNAERSKNRSFSIGIACTVMNKNVHQLGDMVQLADELKVDTINFQPLVKDNANFMDNKASDFWLDQGSIVRLAEEIKKIRRFSPRHVRIYEEPRLELMVDYYRGTLTQNQWRCFGGLKTVFICYSKKQPLIYSCHGICGNLDEISLKKGWESSQARRLRIQAKTCKNPCLQSCYSLESAQSVSSIINRHFKKIVKSHGS